MNGVVLDPADFTATNGTSVVLDSGATVGDQINIYAFKSFTTADMVSKTAGGTFSGAVGFSGGITGDVSFDTNTLHVDSTNNRVGVGTDSPDTIAEIRGANPIVTIRDTETSSGSAEATLRLAETGASDSLGSYWDIKASGGSLHFIDNWDEGGGTGTRVTLTDSGDIQIPISTNAMGTFADSIGEVGSGNFALQVTNTAQSALKPFGIRAEDIRFATGSSERMRIDSSGNVQIATTSSPSTSVFGFALNASGLFKNSRNTGASGASAQIFGNAGEARIMGDGDLLNTNNSYGQISDETLKQDIADAASQWADIKALKVRKFRFKDNPTGTLQIGVIAQELEASGMNGLVKQIDLNQDEDSEETIKAVKYSVLHMKAVKALQEAMERIEALEIKVASLETQNADLETKVADFETRLTALEAE
jgi:chaperonin cofactor prefoldin